MLIASEIEMEKKKNFLGKAWLCTRETTRITENNIINSTVRLIWEITQMKKRANEWKEGNIDKKNLDRKDFRKIIRYSLKMWEQYTDMIRDFYGQYDKVLRRPLGCFLESRSDRVRSN